MWCLCILRFGDLAKDLASELLDKQIWTNLSFEKDVQTKNMSVVYTKLLNINWEMQNNSQYTGKLLSHSEVSQLVRDIRVTEDLHEFKVPLC